MNDYEWMRDLGRADVQYPVESLAGEEVYTLRRGDFSLMPEIDFRELAAFDNQLRALMN